MQRLLFGIGADDIQQINKILAEQVGLKILSLR